MLSHELPQAENRLRAEMREHYHESEEHSLARLLPIAELAAFRQAAVQKSAQELAKIIRESARDCNNIQDLLNTYSFVMETNRL